MATQTIRIHDIDNEYDYCREPVDVEETCPDCGGKIIEYHFANGMDDYITCWECRGCGAEWST